MEANSTGDQGSRRAVAPSDDEDDDNMRSQHKRFFRIFTLLWFGIFVPYNKQRRCWCSKIVFQYTYAARLLIILIKTTSSRIHFK